MVVIRNWRNSGINSFNHSVPKHLSPSEERSELNKQKVQKSATKGQFERQNNRIKVLCIALFRLREVGNLYRY